MTERTGSTASTARCRQLSRDVHEMSMPLGLREERSVATIVTRRPSGRGSRPDRGRMQFEEVVAEADQRPFLLDADEPASQELPKAPRVFDLSEHGFDDRLTSRVDRGPPQHRQLAPRPR